MAREEFLRCFSLQSGSRMERNIEMALEFMQWLLVAFIWSLVKTLFIGGLIAHGWRGFSKIADSEKLPNRTLFGGLCAAFLVGSFFWLPDTFNLAWLGLSAFFAFCAWQSD